LDIIEIWRLLRPAMFLNLAERSHAAKQVNPAGLLSIETTTSE